MSQIRDNYQKKLDILTTLVEAYEKHNYPIDSPTTIESLLYYFESRNQGFSDFINGLKSRGVSEAVFQKVCVEST